MISLFELLEVRINELLEARCLAMFQHTRAHHRRDCQSGNAGNDNRTCKREGKLAEQRSGQTTRKSERRKHRSQRDRHRDNGACDFLHTLEGRIHRTQSLFDMSVNVLQNHDGVIHHQTNRQNHCQK